SEEHTSELQSLTNLVCRLLLEKKKRKQRIHSADGMSASTDYPREPQDDSTYQPCDINRRQKRRCAHLLKLRHRINEPLTQIALYHLTSTVVPRQVAAHVAKMTIAVSKDAASSLFFSSFCATVRVLI